MKIITDPQQADDIMNNYKRIVKNQELLLSFDTGQPYYYNNKKIIIKLNSICKVSELKHFLNTPNFKIYQFKKKDIGKDIIKYILNIKYLLKKHE